jgi:hypothetical protein
MAAKGMLQRTRLAPLMYAATKEAFLARCAAALEMAGHVENYRMNFYAAHVPEYPGTLMFPGLLEEPTAEWCEAVISDALARLS